MAFGAQQNRAIGIERWVLYGCPCRICKVYLGQVGFIITQRPVYNEKKIKILQLSDQEENIYGYFYPTLPAKRYRP